MLLSGITTAAMLTFQRHMKEDGAQSYHHVAKVRDQEYRRMFLLQTVHDPCYPKPQEKGVCHCLLFSQQREQLDTLG